MSEWQPITTAPRDGTYIWVWDKLAGLRSVSWLEDEWAEEDGRPPLGTLTHWMPQPEPPPDAQATKVRGRTIAKPHIFYVFGYWYTLYPDGQLWRSLGAAPFHAR